MLYPLSYEGLIVPVVSFYVVTIEACWLPTNWAVLEKTLRLSTCTNRAPIVFTITCWPVIFVFIFIIHKVDHLGIEPSPLHYIRMPPSHLAHGPC